MCPNLATYFIGGFEGARAHLIFGHLLVTCRVLAVNKVF